MFAGFSALNESSNPDSDFENERGGSNSEESLDFRDDDYLALYNRALSSYGNEEYEKAESEFRHLINSAYFTHCGFYSGTKLRNVAVRLQFNTHRYLGICLANRNAFADALEELQLAIDIDNSDPTLFFKFAVTAVRAGDLMAARNALETSFGVNNNPDQLVRHWPSLDLIISITYKLDDCIACLRYIKWALLVDPKYEKGHRLRGEIYDEYPYLHPDPEFRQRPSKPRPLVTKQLPPPKEVATKVLTVTSLSILDIVNCVVDEYQSGEGGGRMKDLLLPCKVEFRSQLQTEEFKVNKEEVRMIIDSILDQVVEMEVEDEKEETSAVATPKELTEEEQMVSDILDKDVIVKALDYSFIKQIVLKSADFAVGESYANSMSKRRSGLSTTASFLNEVPLDLIEKRRSARRGTYGTGGRMGVDSNSESLLESPRGDDMTAKAMIESLFPPSLVRIADSNTASAVLSPLKKLMKSPVAKKQQVEDLPMKEAWIDKEEEECQAKYLIKDVLSNSCLNSMLSDLLLQLTESLKGVYYWPRPFDRAFLKLYQCWRPHFIPPEECVPQDPHEFLNTMLIANEIVLRDLTAISIYDQANEEKTKQVELLTEYLWDDLQHLVLNMFRLPRQDTLRILSLHLQYYRFKGKIHEAAEIADRMKPFLDRVDAEKLKSPIINCEIFRMEKVNAFLENQRNRQLISKVNHLFDQGKYSLVKDVLIANLDINSTEDPPLTETRMHHFLMMIESLWSLDDYEMAIGWIEQAIDEHMKCNDASISTPSNLLNLLKMFECCIVMLEGNLAGLDEKSRMANNLLKLALLQVDGQSDSLLGEKTILPWILLYHLIAHEEKTMTVFEDDVPCSINFLCSAHDYLGPLSLCTLDSGKLLTFLVSGTVDMLFKGVPNKATNDQLCKYMDQALFCLYAHPSKKSKARHLVDHGISNVAFTWDQCLKPYLYLRPKKLPEYDDLKSASITSEVVIFFRRIIALVPDKHRVKARVKLMMKHLVDESQEEIPIINATVLRSLQSTGDDDSMNDAEIDEEPFPAVLSDLFYLLADHYFKNSEFEQAIDFYLTDLSWNNSRIDSWVPLALSMNSRLESKINEMKNLETTTELIKQILNEAKAILKCFQKCIQLSANSTTVRIESANFAYTLLSYCGRLMSDGDNMESLSIDLFNSVDQLHPVFFEFAQSNYQRALEISTQKEVQGSLNTDNEHDERWLSYLMKGKLLEKKKQSLLSTLEEYVKALQNLVGQGASVPRKINFNSPPDLTLELLEVYYRIHASVLKLELKQEDKSMSLEELQKIRKILQDVESVTNAVFPGKEALNNQPNKEVRQQCEDDGTEVVLVWSIISKLCLKALEFVMQRFPQHFKAVHLTGHYYMRSNTFKDLKKARKYFWGIDGPTPRGNSQPSLFGDRKGNNLFNGIWRLPLNEVDRAGSFSTHMGKCVSNLLDLAMMTNDQAILTEVSVQLKKAPSSDQKYLFEKQRKSFCKQALTGLRKVLKARTDSYIKHKSKETQLGLLLEVYQILVKLRKAYQSKDEALATLMIDLYKSISSASSATFDEVNSFCSRASTPAVATKPATSAIKSSNVAGASGNGIREATSKSMSPNPGASSSKGVSSSASAAANDPKSMKEALEYMNAANYYNELVASMMAASNAEAYLNAYAAASASYNNLLKSLPNTISVTKTDKKQSPATTVSKASSSTKSAPIAKAASTAGAQNKASSSSTAAKKIATGNKPTATSKSITGISASKSITGISASITVTAKSTQPQRPSSLSKPITPSLLPKETNVASVSISKTKTSSTSKTGPGTSKAKLSNSGAKNQSSAPVQKGSHSLTITPNLSSIKQISMGSQSKFTGANSSGGKPGTVLKKQSKTLSGITVSKVSSSSEASPSSLSVGGKGGKKTSAVHHHHRGGSSATVESAKEILAQEGSSRSVVEGAGKLTPAQDAYAKLKSSRNSLSNSLKRTAPTAAKSSIATKKPAIIPPPVVPPPVVAIQDEDDDVICID